MTRLKLTFFIILTFAACSFGEDTFEKVEEFRKFAAAHMKADKIPGMTIGYIDWSDGEKIWVEAFGLSDLENQVPARIDSAYRLGSVSKPITAVAVLKLVEQGKLDLDAEIQTYVPYFPKKKWPVRVRPVLGHIGGISHYQNYEVEGRIKEQKNTREAIAIFDAFDLEAEPGAKYVYSSYGFNLLAAAVEGASGRSFEEYMRDNVWTPLGMINTRLDDPDDLIPNRVRGYRLVNGEIKNSEFVNISSRLGGGGKRSTIPDVLRFAKGLNEGKVISEKSLQMMYTSMATNDGRYTDYGMGIGSGTMNGRFFASHTGSQPETRTVFYLFPARKLAIAAAINQEDASPSFYARHLYHLLTGERWNLSVYSVQSQTRARALESVFKRGMAYFDRHRKAMTTDRTELKKAMKYLERCIGKQPASNKILEDGIHPITGEPFTKIGSYIASKLYEQKGESIFKEYALNGAIPFFHDYFHSTKSREDLKFENSVKREIAKLNRSWNKTNTAQIRSLQFQEPELNTILAHLRSQFSEQLAYPDFSTELAGASLDSITAGKLKLAIEASKAAAELYSQSPAAMTSYGTVLLIQGENKKGIDLIKKAAVLDPEGDARSESLSDMAYEIAEAGRINDAIKVLVAATEIHPKASHLYSDLGEAYSVLQDYKKSAESFKKAIELDPKNEDAKRKLEELSESLKETAN